jgi:potassium uptake Trk family protein
MALLDANAVAIQTNYYPLLTLSLLILAGNTGFPPFLRLVLWVMKKALERSASSPRIQKWRTVLMFILDHPRRVYTNLFPAPQTWWLVLSLVCLNGADWLFFEILNIGNSATDAIPLRYRVLDGLFQAFAVRSGGFYVVNISQLRSGLLVLYVLMMYISALPVTITMRNTNVYEERSLGVFTEDQSEEQNEPAGLSRSQTLMSNLRKRFSSGPGNQSRPRPTKVDWNRGDFLRQQLRGQLGHDLWWIGLAVFLITIIETGQFESNPVVFATFNIIFEVVSAYGTVGISTGGRRTLRWSNISDLLTAAVPWNAYSFSGAWHTGSKLVLCAVMLRGRHRGLPVAIDKAVLLPDETLAWAEEEDAQKRSLMRRKSEELGAIPEQLV